MDEHNETTPVDAEAPIIDNEAPQVEAPVDTAAHEADPEMTKWVEGAKLMGYESRLGEGQSMEDLYHSMHGIEVADAPVADEVELEVPSSDGDDSSLSIEEPAEEDATDAPEATARPSTEDWAAWTAEIDTTGDLSNDARDAIKSGFGFDDAVVDTFMAGRKAMQRAAYSDAAPVVGGEATLKSVLEWAGGNLSAEERTANNAALLGPQRDTVLLGLKARYDAANPAKVAKAAEPSPVKNKAVAAPQAVKGFTSQAEMSAHINSPRYKHDPEFRQSVQERINKSNFLF